ncbi:MAG: MucBP domain-containing protein, partial [Ruminococcus sp.]
VDTMNSVRNSLDNLTDGTKLLMYGEPWVMSTTTDKDVVLANVNNIDKLSDRIGAFDDTYRDALKGSTSGNDKGFIQSGKNKPNLRTGIAGQSDSVIGWAKSPNQCVTYGSCHDNLTMWDKLVKSVKGDDADYTARYSDLVAMNKLAGAITFTSQGTSFMLAGEEFCRTKKGDENSYSSGFKINQIDWNFVETYGDVSDYYKGLMEIRENISAFRDSTSNTANSIKYLEDCPTNVLAYEVNDSKFGRVFVAFNGGDNDETVSTQGSWVQLADENTAGMNSLGNVGDKLKLAPHSAAILVDRTSYSNLNITSDTGKVIVRYFDGDNVIKSYVINGKIGDSYEVSYLPSVLMDYDISNVSGKSGKFSNAVKYCDISCKPFSGDYSSVTFQFLDGEKGTAVADFTVMTNRNGQKYQTMSIPSVEGYCLDMERLPKNGCGEFTDKDQKVKYYYNKVNPKDKTYRVNIIYMSTTGEIIGTDTLNGELNTEYTTTQIELENYEYLSVTDNYDGVFAPTEQNVLYIYSPVSIIPKVILIVSIFALLIIVIIAVLVVNKRKKERLINNLEFV